MMETGEDRHTLLGYRKTASILRNFSMQFSRLPGLEEKASASRHFDQVVDCGEPTARLRPATMARIALCSESRG
jgi:hypothetical protein